METLPSALRDPTKRLSRTFAGSLRLPRRLPTFFFGERVEVELPAAGAVLELLPLVRHLEEPLGLKLG